MKRKIFLSLMATAFLILAPHAGRAQETSPSGGASKPATVVNLNSADAGQLASLPGIGERTAQRIIEYRQKNGPFKKPEDLMNIKGIGEKAFLKLKNLITVGPAKADRAATDPNAVQSHE